jgi:SAM-dependent methyltransferase
MKRRRTHAEAAKAFYRAWAPYYDTDAETEFLARLEFPALGRALTTKATDRILDVGCGTGRNIPLLLRRTRRVEGADVSEDMLRVARAKFPAVPFFAADLDRKIPVRSGAYDVIVCTRTLHFLEHPERALAEFRRILKPGGSVIITAWIDDTLMNWDHVRYRRRSRAPRAIGPKTKRYYLSDVLDLFDAARFAVVRTQPLRVGPACRKILTDRSYEKLVGKFPIVLFVLEKA